VGERDRYYTLYNERYHRVYAQGIPYWTADPEEIARTVGHLDRFLTHVGAVPDRTSIIEFGCGEGHLAQHLLSLHFRYLGVDASPLALEKARGRTAQEGGGDAFLRGDITCLRELKDRSFDVGVDNFCLHMLVTDPDRQRYLSEVSRVLRKGGWAYFHEVHRPDGFPARVNNYQEFLERFHPDLTTLEEREAYAHGAKRKIQLPRLPMRADNEEGYRREFAHAGLTVEAFRVSGHTCTIWAQA